MIHVESANHIKNKLKIDSLERVESQKIIIILVGVCLTIGVLFRSISVLLLTSNPIVQSPFYDDGFYYLEIARNAAHLGQFTFDQIHRTNGFHPLWQILLAGLAYISSEDFVLIRLVMFFSILLFVVTGVLLFKFVSNIGGVIAGLGSVLLWSFSPDLLMWQNNGMENTLYLPLLLFTMIQLDRFTRNPSNWKQALVFGLSASLLFWSRSDAVLFSIFALIAIILILWKRSMLFRRDHLLPLIIAAAVPFLFGIGYLLFNYFAAGSFLSVSSVVKVNNSSNIPWTLSQTTAAIILHARMLLDLFSDLGGLGWWNLNKWTVPFKIAAFAWIITAIVWWIRSLRRRDQANSQRPFVLSVILLLLYTILHSLILVTLLRFILRWTPWYIVPQVLFILVCLPLILFPKELVENVKNKEIALFKKVFAKQDSVLMKKDSLIPLFNLAFFFVFVLVPCIWVMTVPLKGLRQMQSAENIDPRFELGTWLRTNTPPGATIGMFDAGMVGYFAHRHVINLDGLVNSPDYLEVLRSRKFADYVIQNQFDYLIYYYFPPYHMNAWFPTDDSQVCHKLETINKNWAIWGNMDVKNYFEVIALRYDGKCSPPWQAGLPREAIPPTGMVESK